MTKHLEKQNSFFEGWSYFGTRAAKWRSTDEMRHLEWYSDFTDLRKPSKWASHALADVMVRAYHSTCESPILSSANIDRAWWWQVLNLDEPFDGYEDKPMGVYDDVFHQRKPTKKWSHQLARRMMKETGNE